jgi:hypothetical protein
MLTNENKTTVSVLLNIPRELYNEYLKTLSPRCLKTQSHSAELFIAAIEKEIDDFNKLKAKKKK